MRRRRRRRRGRRRRPKGSANRLKISEIIHYTK